MARIEDYGEVISTDVLIVGGGVGGLAAALKAKEANPGADVLIVEKQTTGWAGKASKIGGFLAFLGPHNNADKFIDFQVRSSGYYMNNQEALTKYVQSTYPAIEDLTAWGAKLARTPDGKLVTIPAFWAPEYSITFVDIDLMLPMRTKARQAGTRILNKIHITDLLKQDQKVVGAVGFDIVTGRFYIFKAKATVLANGSCGYKVRRFWVAGTGDGIAAAFRAGAEMRNAEYGNLYGHTVYQDTDSGMVGSAFLVNARGENLTRKYVPDMGPAGVFLPAKLIVGMEKEILEGRGPIYFSPPPEGSGQGPQKGLPELTAWMQRLAAKEKKYGLPPEVKREIAVPLHGETSCIKVSPEMRTSLEGLWAIGDTSYAGSAVAGAVASPPGVSPGSGIMYAVISGSWAGPSAAGYAANSSEPVIDPAEVQALKEKCLAPLKKEKGYLPADAVSVLQSVTAPIKYNLRRSRERLLDALLQLENLKPKLPGLQAKDPHYLSKCHEVESMVLCAELTFRAALMRTESRGFHFREDFPETDNRNWLKWVILKQEAGKMKLFTEAVPMDRFKIRPAI
ncbi:MAG TPA: FAD-dependent oxidoreductase [Dehalococcoidales bacterium]|nr:FAD-dependent oxidoreductase [Dehalococcoidales bacterium]